MRWTALGVLAAPAVAAAALVALRDGARADERGVDEAWRRLLRTVTIDPAPFDPASVAHLPEPARRFLTRVIRPGTPLAAVAEVTMRGEFGFGPKAAPAYRPMRACQILAMPDGFVWQAAVGREPFGLRGSDGLLEGRSWTRFRFAGLVPVARFGGDSDHARSSFGRGVADASFWTPAALMPSKTVRWEAAGSDVARVSVTRGDLVQAIDLSLDATGLPVRVAFDRWSNANADKVYRWQRFGGELSDFREFDGFTVPTRVLAGNHFGTDRWFASFIAAVDRVRFVSSPVAARGCVLARRPPEPVPATVPKTIP